MNSKGWKKRLKHKLAYHLGVDRRTQLRDISSIKPDQRSSKSPIIQFYSGVPNIGNYLPVLGIRRMLGDETDLWDAHDKRIDWDFVNKNYSWAIVGGAGLLHAAFEDFWAQLGTHCELPFVVWGVGACFPDSETESGVSVRIARPVLENAALINLRDDITAEHYDLSDVHISPCPTIVYLENRNATELGNRGRILYSSHTELVGKVERNAVYKAVESTSSDFVYTDNIERRLEGLDDIIESYAQSSLVVTTRLHGAIIAYALRVPYIALARDDKVRAFQRLYGNGVLVEKIEEIHNLLENVPNIEVGPVDVESVYAFGRRVNNWRRDGVKNPIG